MKKYNFYRNLVVHEFDDFDSSTLWYKEFYFIFLPDLASGNEFWISGSDSSTENHWLWYGSIQSWGYTKWNSGTHSLKQGYFIFFLMKHTDPF
jgi:hypothetical protein